MPSRRSSTSGSQTKRIKVEYENDEQSVDQPSTVKAESINFDDFKFQPNTSVKPEQTKPEPDIKGQSVDVKQAESATLPPQQTESEGPPHWREVFDLILQMRASRDAPVDMQGCDRAGDQTTDPKVQRYRILVSLMLSAQTKDPVTHAAMQTLNARWPDGLTIQNIQSVDEAELDTLIQKVGFHTRKAAFIKRTSDILANHFDYDIPDSVEGLCSLPGVGPKMAHLAMNSAWQRVMGIGVDVHVHRIANRLGWVSTREAEETREDLQAFVPYSMWNSINKVLVGFGQQMCLPRAPKCTECLANHLCPVGKVNVERHAKGLSPLNPTKQQARAAVKPTKRKRTVYAKFDESTPSPRSKQEVDEDEMDEEEEKAEKMEALAEALEEKEDDVGSSSVAPETAAQVDVPETGRRAARSRKINYKE